MEKRLGIIAIVITSKENVLPINNLISDYSEIIIARQVSRCLTKVFLLFHSLLKVR